MIMMMTRDGVEVIGCTEEAELKERDALVGGHVREGVVGVVVGDGMAMECGKEEGFEPCGAGLGCGSEEDVGGFGVEEVGNEEGGEEGVFRDEAVVVEVEGVEGAACRGGAPGRDVASEAEEELG